jgi:hypothetical protein
MAVELTVGDFDYAMVATGEDLRPYIGYREGVVIDDATGDVTNLGTFVVGSNNGWGLAASVRDVLIYVRRHPEAEQKPEIPQVGGSMNPMPPGEGLDGEDHW